MPAAVRRARRHVASAQTRSSRLAIPQFAPSTGSNSGAIDSCQRRLASLDCTPSTAAKPSASSKQPMTLRPSPNLA